MGLSSLIIAVIALLYARQQFYIARNNQRLEHARRRLESVSSLYRQIVALHEAYYEARRHLIHIAFIIENDSEDGEIYDYTGVFVKAWNELDAKRSDVRQFSLDQIADGDLQEIAERLNDDTNLKRERSPRLIAESVRSFQEVTTPSHGYAYRLWASSLRSNFAAEYQSFYAKSESISADISAAVVHLEQVATELKAMRKAVIDSNLASPR